MGLLLAELQASSLLVLMFVVVKGALGLSALLMLLMDVFPVVSSGNLVETIGTEQLLRLQARKDWHSMVAIHPICAIVWSLAMSRKPLPDTASL